MVAEVNPKAAEMRHKQGWVDEVFTDLDTLIERMLKARNKKEVVSLAYQGNVIELWEKLAEKEYKLIWDPTRHRCIIHLPVVITRLIYRLNESNEMMAEQSGTIQRESTESLTKTCGGH